MIKIEHNSSNAETYQVKQAELLSQYKSKPVERSCWRGRAVQAGIILGAITLVAAAAALVALGVLSANPLLIGLGLALGTCVIIAGISYFSTQKILPEQEFRILEKIKSSVFDDEHETIGVGLDTLGDMAVDQN